MMPGEVEAEEQADEDRLTFSGLEMEKPVLAVEDDIEEMCWIIFAHRHGLYTNADGTNPPITLNATIPAGRNLRSDGLPRSVDEAVARIYANPADPRKRFNSRFGQHHYPSDVIQSNGVSQLSSMLMNEGSGNIRQIRKKRKQ